MTPDEFAAAVGWPKKALWGRLKALDLLEVCERCGGSGKHSFNRDFADTCFGCKGAQLVLPKLTSRLATDVRAREAKGDLVLYFKSLELRRAAAEMIKPYGERAKALYDRAMKAIAVLTKEHDDIDRLRIRTFRKLNDAYASREEINAADRSMPALPKIPDSVYRMKGMLTALYVTSTSKSSRTKFVAGDKNRPVEDPTTAPVMSLVAAYKEGDIANPILIVAELEDRISHLEALVVAIEANLTQS
jgi:hypothetical protein